MPSKLHKDMITTCQNELGIAALNPSLGQYTYKSKQVRPDVKIDDNSAVECRIISFHKLEEYSQSYNYLILTLPIPECIREVWLFDTKNSTIREKIDWNRKEKVLKEKPEGLDLPLRNS